MGLKCFLGPVKDSVFSLVILERGRIFKRSGLVEGCYLLGAYPQKRLWNALVFLPFPATVGWIPLSWNPCRDMLPMSPHG